MCTFRKLIDLCIMSRVYDGKRAVGVRLNNGRLYDDALIINMMKAGVDVQGLTIREGKLAGANGIDLGKIRREQIKSIGQKSEN